MDLPAAWALGRDRARMTLLVKGAFGALKLLGGTLMAGFLVVMVVGAPWIGGIVWVVTLASCAPDLFQAYRAMANDPLLLTGRVVRKVQHRGTASQSQYRTGTTGRRWSIELAIERAQPFDAQGRLRELDLTGTQRFSCDPEVWHAVSEGESVRLFALGSREVYAGTQPPTDGARSPERLAHRAR